MRVRNAISSVLQPFEHQCTGRAHCGCDPAHAYSNSVVQCPEQPIIDTYDTDYPLHCELAVKKARVPKHPYDAPRK
jgi:hypothetical protein